MTTADDAVDEVPAAVEYEIDWTVKKPEFAFDSEVQALMTLQNLGEDLKNARRQLQHVMRYMRAAVLAAREPMEDGKPVSKEAIIGHTGMARKTVYAICEAAPSTTAEQKDGESA